MYTPRRAFLFREPPGQFSAPACFVFRKLRERDKFGSQKELLYFARPYLIHASLYFPRLNERAVYHSCVLSGKREIQGGSAEKAP